MWTKLRAVFLVAASFFGLLWLGSIDDWLRCWRSPESHVDIEQVVVLERRCVLDPFEKVVLAPRSVSGATAESLWNSLQNRSQLLEMTSADFDRDGVDDRLSTIYFHMEPIFDESSSGMVLVESGATGRILLGHKTATPLSLAQWCGDVDGNGTQDVFITDSRRAVVLSHR